MARPVSSDDARHTKPLASRGELALNGLVVTTYFARFYLPAESAAQGETLWIVSLWLFIGFTASLVAWRGRQAGRRLDGLDVAVLLLTGGQVASAVMVVMTTGDKRAAVNMAWEWLGVGVLWFVLRSRLANASFRESFVRASIVTGVVLAGLGLWQHYVSQPQTAAEYGPLFDRLRTASGPEAAAIHRKLAAAGIPTEGPGLTLFEKRLRDSREPMGLFGLANTLGGCLAVWQVMALAQLLSELRSDRSRWRIVVSLLAVGLIAWCLLLTKSRTAVVGAGCGTLVLLVGRWSPSLKLRRVMRSAGLVICGLLAAIGLLCWTGGLDREVLSEATKSLGYRLQYWQATSRLVVDHVWLGVGPGNFRQHYLKYKLPEASEEIADPHNMLFDVAATGGAVSFLGLILLLGCVVGSRLTVKRTAATAEGDAARTHGSRSLTPQFVRSEFWFGGLAPMLAFVGLLSLSGEWDDRPLALAVAWLAIASLWLPPSGSSQSEQTSARTCFAAFVVLAVHLLGAGGIAMPVISQLLLALIVCSLTRNDEPAINTHATGRRWLVIASVSAILFFGLILTALGPVVRCRALLARGDQMVISSGMKMEDVMPIYRSASLADPLSPEPKRRLAELAFREAEEDRFRSNDLFDSAVRWQREVIASDPYNFQGPQSLGNGLMTRWRVMQYDDDARQAVNWLRQASDSYPSNASLLAKLSEAYRAAEEHSEAMTTARRALDQDKLNRTRGHVDRYLSDEVIEMLKKIKDEG